MLLIWNLYFMIDNIKRRMINLMDIFDRYINQIDIIYEINQKGNELEICLLIVVH